MKSRRRAALAGLLALLAPWAADARADNLVCQSIGNKTECRRSDGPLACFGDTQGPSCSAPPQASKDSPEVLGFDPEELLDLGDGEEDEPSAPPLRRPRLRFDGGGIQIILR